MKTTNHSQTLDSLLEEIQKQLCRELKARSCTVALYDAASQQLLAHKYPVKKEDSATFSFPLGQGILGLTASQLKPYSVADLSKEAKRYPGVDDQGNAKTKSLLAFPMKQDGKLIGVLGVLDKSGGKAFKSGDLSRLKKLAEEAGSRFHDVMQKDAEKKQIEQAAIHGLIKGLSHYLKHLLHGISTGAAAVDNALKQRNMSMLKSGWQMARQNEKKIANLVRDLIYLIGEKKTSLIPAEPVELVRSVALTLKPMALDKKVSLKLELPEQLPEIMADPVALHRALHHVILNAIEACDQEQKKVTVTADIQAPHLRIIIHDTGHGISANHLKQIFEPFFSTREHLGAGIGLAVTKKVVEEHGGEVEVTSNAGQGATFTLKLPVKAEEKSHAKKKKSKS